MTEKNVVAVIPARGGSRGVKDKNLREVGGKTLVQRSIEHAQESEHIMRVLVTSDSPVILLHAQQLGAEPIVRPAYLATDTASGDEVIIHALEAIGVTKDVAPEHLTVFLQPTSPLRPEGLIDYCISRVRYRDSIFTANRGHFTWKLVRNEGWTHNPHPERDLSTRYEPAVGDMSTRRMRQNLSIYEIPYHENGSVYVSRTALLMRERNRLCGDIGMVEMEPEDAIDIDTEYDLWIANQRARYLEENPPTVKYHVTERGLVSVPAGVARWTP